MRVLLVDTTQFYPSSPMFLDPMEQLASENILKHEFVDEARYLEKATSSLLAKVVYRLLGRRPITYWSFNRHIRDAAKRISPDVMIVVKGAFISPGTLSDIKDKGAYLINFATDDPFNPSVNTPDMIKGIPFYDMYACTKRNIIDDVRSAGGTNVTFLPFGFNPKIHFMEKPKTRDEKAQFDSDVVFIGGCDEDRIPYFENLVRAIPDINLHLYGGYWNQNAALRKYHKGFAIGRDYRLALSGARIVVNLVRRANRDGHVMRTFEVPACGGFMLADRTREHLEMFKEGKDAAFFNSSEEMVEKAKYYLSHYEERQQIAEAGFLTVTEGKNSYKDRLLQLLSHLELAKA